MRPMASYIQRQDYGNWSCLPRNNRTNQPDGNGPALVPSRRNANSGGQEEIQTTEELLATELNKLSVQERAEAFNDVHCVGEELQETPDMIHQALADYETLVQNERNVFYEMALTQNRAYVDDPSFRLMFLRAKLYNVREAVRQMMNFLQHKATYFGIDKVAQEITLDDLNEEEKRILLSGFYHIQEERDQTGRIIMHWFGKKLGRRKAENVIRAAYMLRINILLRDPVAQTKGVVTVYHNTSSSTEKFEIPRLDFIRTVTNVTSSFPVRYSAVHYCLQTEEGNLDLYNKFLGLALNTLPSYSKVRSRIHVGSTIELQYALRSHGIPIDTFPIDIGGNIRDDIFYAWFYKYQREQMGSVLSSNVNSLDPNSVQTEEDMVFFALPEIADLSAEIGEPLNFEGQLTGANLLLPFAVKPSTKPTKNDILLGRRRITQSWPGNIQFREFLEMHSFEYNKLPRNERKKRTIELTQELSAKLVRFFEENGAGEWVEIDMFEARKKVSQFFRTMRKKKY